MSSISQQLSHPEIMSKETLIEILKTRCIQMPDTSAMSKEELLNLYRHIALPLPQRDHSHAGHFGKRMASLREKKCIPIASYDRIKDLEKLSQNHVLNGNHCNPSMKRLKPPIENTCPTKKIKLIDNTFKDTANVSFKNKACNNSEAVSPSKQKRQKITWP